MSSISFGSSNFAKFSITERNKEQHTLFVPKSQVCIEKHGPVDSKSLSNISLIDGNKGYDEVFLNELGKSSLSPDEIDKKIEKEEIINLSII